MKRISSASFIVLSVLALTACDLGSDEEGNNMVDNVNSMTEDVESGTGDYNEKLNEGIEDVQKG